MKKQDKREMTDNICERYPAFTKAFVEYHHGGHSFFSMAEEATLVYFGPCLFKVSNIINDKYFVAFRLDKNKQRSLVID